MARTLVRLAVSQKSNFPKRLAALELQELLTVKEGDDKEPSPFDDFDDEAFGDDEEEENDAPDGAKENADAPKADAKAGAR